MLYNCHHLIEIQLRQLSVIVDYAEEDQSGVETHSPSFELFEVSSLVTKYVNFN